MPVATPDNALLWSARGEVACREHAPNEDDARWQGERWKPIPAGAQGRHGRSYRCQYCAEGDRVILHAPRPARGARA